MELLRWKTRIAVLWIILGVNYLTYLNMLSAAVIKEAEAQGSEGWKPAFAVIVFLPFLLAWFALTLKNSANRWINVVFGILVAIIKLTYMIQYSTTGKSMPIAFNEL